MVRITLADAPRSVPDRQTGRRGFPLRGWLRRLFGRGPAAPDPALLRLIVDDSPDGILVTDAAGTVCFVNAAMAQMLGAAPDEPTGSHVQRYVKLAGAAGGQPLRLDRLAGGRPNECGRLDAVCTRQDGSSFPAAIAARELRLGQTWHLLTACDVSQCRRMDETQRQAIREAQAANRAKLEFLAMVSHELRTPLNAVIGFSEMIKDQVLGPVDNPQYLSYVRDIHECGTHLRSVVEDILDISKVEGGRYELREEELSIADAAASALRLIRGREEAAGLALELDVRDGLPALRADPQALKQVLLNLVANAVKFTDTGRVAVQAGLDAENRLSIRVADSGCGIPADEIDRVTEAFYQVDSDLDRRYEGTGLGLSLVKSLLELHDATLHIDSKLGEGTTVTCRFPATRTVPLEAAGRLPEAHAHGHG